MISSSRFLSGDSQFKTIVSGGRAGVTRASRATCAAKTRIATETRGLSRHVAAGLRDAARLWLPGRAITTGSGQTAPRSTKSTDPRSRKGSCSRRVRLESKDSPQSPESECCSQSTAILSDLEKRIGRSGLEAMRAPPSGRSMFSVDCAVCSLAVVAELRNPRTHRVICSEMSSISDSEASRPANAATTTGESSESRKPRSSHDRQISLAVRLCAARVMGIRVPSFQSFLG